MSWTKNDKDRDEKDGPRGYHHGNLKEALLRAALELIAQKGPGGFTFAEAARWAGVSPAAPYRHFRDRDELLASVAQELGTSTKKDTVHAALREVVDRAARERLTRRDFADLTPNALEHLRRPRKFA